MKALKGLLDWKYRVIGNYWKNLSLQEDIVLDDE